MDFFDLVNISERFMQIVNPSTPEKILKVGEMAGLSKGKRVIDFGCGFGEALALWGERYGIGGIGIDLREYACERARSRLAAFGDRFEIVCTNAAEYQFQQHAFDVATCIGATFIWGGFRETVRAMKSAIREGGRLVIGESYWLSSHVPPEFARSEGFPTEVHILHMARAEGFDIERIVRSTREEWDRYESDNWYGLLRWIDENPGHPERQAVVDYLHRNQEEYFQYMREFVGWAMYLLKPRTYAEG